MLWKLPIRLRPRSTNGSKRRVDGALILLLLTLLPNRHLPAGESEGNPRVDAEIAVTQGIIAYQLGDHSEALRWFERAPKDDAIAAEYRKLIREQVSPKNKVTPASRDVPAPEIFEVVDGEQTVPPVAGCGPSGSICGTPGMPLCVPEARNWNLTFFTGYQYDSNVTLTPQFSGLGSDQGIEDSAWLAALFGDYRVVQKETMNLGVIGSVFSNFYFNDGRDLNVQDYMGGVYSNVALSQGLLAGIRYEHHSTFLDADNFAGESRLVPNITFRRPGVGHVTAYYEFDNTSFDDAPLIPAMDLNGDTHAVGVTQALYTCGGDGRIFVGYRYEERFTSGTDFDRQTHQITGRIEHPITERIIADADYRYFLDDYLEPNSLDFLDRARDDHRSEVRAGLQFIAGEHLSYRLDYTFIAQSSNVENLFGVRFYDYNRHLLAAQVIYDF